MPEWERLVRERLGALGIDAEREEEVFAELAAHLEDTYDGYLQRGWSPERALACAFSEIRNAPRLSREIRRAAIGDDPMTERTKSFWLPGMAMLFLYAILLRAVILMGLRPNVFWFGPRMPMLGYAGLPLVVYVPWLVLLPAVGALGAWWSKRAGGRVPARLLAGLFPVIALLALLALGFAVALVVDPQVPLPVKGASLGLYLLGWILMPGAALLLGALPFLRTRSGGVSPSGA